MEWDSTLLGEEDSLLQQTPSHIKNQSDARTCEPLVRHNCKSPKDTSNKENISTNRLEGANLSVESVQMKKKKKGGGYNLRKSLAWNKAFFTEEGVLDPLELSMITGTLGNSTQDSLPSISEEGINLLSEDYLSTMDSADPQAVENNLLKEVPAVSLKGDRKSIFLPPKHKSPAHNNWTSASVTCHKVLPAPDASKTGSRGGGCPQPLSSLKRPSNENSRQTVMKQSKLPRTPASKPGHSLTSATSKSVLHGASQVKQKQIAQSLVNIQKNGVKRLPKTVKTKQNIRTAGSESLPVRSLASHTRRNSVDSPIYRHPSIQSQSTTAKIADNSGPRGIPNNAGPSIAVHSSRGGDRSIASTVSLPQNVLIMGNSTQHKQIPSTKVSGLRMPSPSLGFFGQPKTSVSNCGSRGAVDAHILGLRKVGDLRPPHLIAKIPEFVNDVMQTVDTMVLKSGIDLNADSQERVKEDVGLNEELKFSNETECSEPMSHKQMSTHSTTNINEKFQHLVKHEINLLFLGDGGNDRTDDKLLLETEPSGYLKADGSSSNEILGGRGNRKSTGNDWANSLFLSQHSPQRCSEGSHGSRNTSENSREDEKSCNYAVADRGILYKSQSGDAISCGLANSTTILCKPLRCMRDDDDDDPPYKEHSDRFKSFTGEALYVPHGDEHLIMEKGKFDKPLRDSQKFASENTENAHCSEHAYSEMRNVDSSCQHKCANQLEECLMTDDVTLKSHVEETELQVSENILTGQNCEDSLSQHLEVDNLNEQSGKCLELQTLFVEQIPQHTQELPPSDCLLVDEGMGSEGYLQEATKTLLSVTSKEGAKSELESSAVEIAQVVAGMEGGPLDINKMVGQDFVEDPVLNAVESARTIENHDRLPTTNVSSDVICIDVPSLAFRSSSNEVSQILFGGKCGTYNGNQVQNRLANENNLMVDEPQNVTLLESPHRDPETAVANCGSLLAESKVINEDQKCNLQSFMEADPTLLGCSTIILEKSPNLAKVEYMRQINDDEKKLSPSRHSSQRGDELLCEPDSNVAVECCINRTMMVFDKDIADSYSVEESGQLELPNCSIMVKKVPQSDNALPLENRLSGERTVQVELEENRIFDIGVYAVRKSNETAGSESKSSTAVSSATLSMQVSGDDGEKFIVDSYMKCASSNFLEIKPSTEKDNLLTESQMNLDLLANGDPTMSRGRNGEDSGLEKSTLPDEIKSKVPQGIVSLVEDSHSDINSALGLRGDKDETVPLKKSESTSNLKSLTIMPPRNAVPFSDEWLAAIEAAGEDILTLKSGAVQNSPPDKYPPEPNPWSPVKRKNTSIGPYDCTKFTNNLPSDYQ